MTRFDLHIHSALSACAENLLSPRQILVRAQRAGLQVIALTDHNASGHVALATALAPEFGLTVIPAMEIASREEVHVLVYFPTPEALADFQQLVDAALPALPNHVDLFGAQVLFDAADEVVALDERLRQVGTTLGVGRIVDEVKQRGGAVVPAHVFRGKFSLISQLGFIDPEARFDALEISRTQWRRDSRRLGSRTFNYPIMTSSDAHFLDDIGRVRLESPRDTTQIHELIDSLPLARAVF